MNVSVRDLRDEDRAYALASLRESHKQSPETSRVPWSYYKDVWETRFKQLFADPTTTLVGAYDEDEGGNLVGWLAMTYGKRVNTLHYVYTRFAVGKEKTRRRGVMTKLFDAVGLGSTFIYTLRGRRHRAALPNGQKSKSLDEALVAHLHGKHVTATYVPLTEYLR